MPPWQCTDIDLVTIYVAHAARSPSAPPAGCCLRRRPVEQCNKKEKACTYAGGSSAAAGGERRISSRVISLRRPAAEPWSGGWGHRRTISHMRPQSLTLIFFSPPAPTSSARALVASSRAFNDAEAATRAHDCSRSTSAAPMPRGASTSRAPRAGHGPGGRAR